MTRLEDEMTKTKDCLKPRARVTVEQIVTVWVGSPASSHYLPETTFAGRDLPYSVRRGK